MDRTFFKSIYLRDPDGHIVELATVGPGITPTPSRRRPQPLDAGQARGSGDSERGGARALGAQHVRERERWRSVSVPTALFSGTPIDISRRRQRARPQRF